MHILFVTPAYPPMPGGGERYAAALAGQLRQRGHRVSVVTSTATREHDLWAGSPGPGDMSPDEAVARLPVRAFPGGRSGLLAYRRAMIALSALPGDQSSWLSRLARRVPAIDGLDEALAAAPPVDVIHAFNLSWESALVAAASLAEARRRPLVVTPFAHFGAGAHDRVARNSTMDHQVRILREAAAVQVLTGIERQRLIELGVAAERVDVLGGGADPLPPEWEAALTAPEASDWPGCFVLFVGRAGRDKGAIDAGEAVLALRRRGRDVSLVVAGATAPEFDRWLAGQDAGDRAAIRVLGIVPEATKHALLSRAQLLALPSRSDSFGIVLLEAWQHGTPVIGARAGGIPGVIDDGRDGLLVDYGDVAGLAAAMERLLGDPEEAAALGEQGRRKVTTELTWEAAAARTENAYRRVLAAAGGPD